MEIRGTTTRRKITDYYQRCKGCGKVFYFDHDSNGKIVVCPYCGTKH